MEKKTERFEGYGLADLAAPYIQFKGTLGECFWESKGLALCGIYVRTNTGCGIIELDVIGICCDYAEYENLAEFQTNYSTVKVLSPKRFNGDIKMKTDTIYQPAIDAAMSDVKHGYSAARNPYIASSNMSDAYLFTIWSMRTHGKPPVIHKSRGSTWRIETPEGVVNARIEGYDILFW